VADQNPISEQIRVNDTPGAPNGLPGAGIKLPGTLATVRANPIREYVSGGVGGSGTWYSNLVRTLPWAD